tara:strand:+ start:208 stop:864 length:657 start_codon:yes stop_codon:yes gene_type:complete
MKVYDAVKSRSSIRKFTNEPVRTSQIRKLLEQSSRAPSGGNLQPWRIFVINNKSMEEFLEFQKNWTGQDEAAYEIYPPSLGEPYRSSRYEVGEEMYKILNIPREDKSARVNQVMKNFEFFGAPAALFCFIDKQMGPPQWSDLGMFLQTFMLLAQEQGIDTCAQEAWSIKSKLLSNFFNVEENLMIFCGLAIGHRDHDAPINRLKTSRRSIEEWAKFLD